MKKISLKSLNLKEVEQLSREQLKNVLGGSGAESVTVAKCDGHCTKHSQCPSECSDCSNYTTSGGLCKKPVATTTKDFN